MDASSISKLRKEYYESLEDIQTWITKAEHILSSTQPNSDEELRFYGRQLAVGYLVFFFLNSSMDFIIFFLNIFF